MDDAGFVRGAHRAPNLHDDVERFVGVDAASRDPPLERLAFVVRHREEDAAVRRLIDFVNRANVGMVERRRGLRFVHEPLLRVAVLHERQRQEFQRHGALELGVFRLVDLAHAARAEQRQHAIVRDRFAENHVRGFWRLGYPIACYNKSTPDNLMAAVGAQAA